MSMVRSDLSSRSKRVPQVLPLYQSTSEVAKSTDTLNPCGFYILYVDGADPKNVPKRSCCKLVYTLQS